MDFDIQRIGRSYSFTSEGGNSYVTFMTKCWEMATYIDDKGFYIMDFRKSMYGTGNWWLIEVIGH